MGSIVLAQFTDEWMIDSGRLGDARTSHWISFRPFDCKTQTEPDLSRYAAIRLQKKRTDRCISPAAAADFCSGNGAFPTSSSAYSFFAVFLLSSTRPRDEFETL